MSLTKGELVYVPAGVTLHQDDPEFIGIVMNHVCLEEPKYLLCLGIARGTNKVAVVYEGARWLAKERDIYQVHEEGEDYDC
tara:strand:+ start:4309 stop:4551 length:243 start_codon:yes stop_codon:yes gene_type:complete